MICQCPDHRVEFGKKIPCTNIAKKVYLNRKTREELALCSECTWDIHVWVKDLEENNEKI